MNRAEGRAPGRAVRRVVAGALAVGTVLAVSAPPASAHTALTGSDPKKNSSVAPPSQIVLTYSENIRLPRVILTDASGKEHQAGTAKAVDNKVTQAVSGVLPFGNQYTVSWRVVSADGHPVSGSYRFTVDGTPKAEASQPVMPMRTTKTPTTLPSPPSIRTTARRRAGCGSG